MLFSLGSESSGMTSLFGTGPATYLCKPSTNTDASGALRKGPVLQCCMNCIACNGYTRSTTLLRQRRQRGSLGWPGDCADCQDYMRRDRRRRVGAFPATHEFATSAEASGASSALRERRGKGGLTIEVPRQKTNIPATEQQCVQVPASLKGALASKTGKRDLSSRLAQLRDVTNTSASAPSSLSFLRGTQPKGPPQDNDTTNAAAEASASRNEDMPAVGTVHVTLLEAGEPTKSSSSSSGRPNLKPASQAGAAADDASGTVSMYLRSFGEVMAWCYEALFESRGCLSFLAPPTSSVGTSSTMANGTAAAAGLPRVTVEEVGFGGKSITTTAAATAGHSSMSGSSSITITSQVVTHTKRPWLDADKAAQQPSGVGSVSPFSPSTATMFPIAAKSTLQQPARSSASGASAAKAHRGEWDTWW
mmetsp:Transcript_6598/g.24493  ORF Transcript_6598/g.24493 Transcript_6598/m.24493 type:complete len:420 (-) Transcript_6598:1983-3242(-)